MKDDPLKAATSRAVLKLLEPLAHLLLDAGIGVGEVQALTELAFVSAACRDQLEAGDKDPDNVAKISVRTGLYRDTVTQLLTPRRQLSLRNKPFQNMAALVLRAWCTESDYLDPAGLPAILPIRGPAPSFQSLVQLASPEGLSRTILKDLLRVNAVKRPSKNQVEVVRKTYARPTWKEEMVPALGNAGQHLRVLVNQLQQREDAGLHRYVINCDLDETHAAILQREFSGQVNSLFNSLNYSLTHETVRAAPNAKKSCLSASIFVLREPAIEPEGSHRLRETRSGGPKRPKKRRPIRKKT